MRLLQLARLGLRAADEGRGFGALAPGVAGRPPNARSAAVISSASLTAPVALTTRWSAA
jgi:hypothetical protein